MSCDANLVIVEGRARYLMTAKYRFFPCDNLFGFKAVWTPNDRSWSDVGAEQRDSQDYRERLVMVGFQTRIVLHLPMYWLSTL